MWLKTSELDGATTNDVKDEKRTNLSTAVIRVLLVFYEKHVYNIQEIKINWVQLKLR